MNLEFEGGTVWDFKCDLLVHFSDGGAEVEGRGQPSRGHNHLGWAWTGYRLLTPALVSLCLLCSLGRRMWEAEE
jgi:hypothetical protein